MKVAIIGAGVAGLSCAHELEKYGVQPVIYERSSFIGEQASFVTCLLEITHRPIKDSIKYIYEKFGIEIQPLNTLTQLIHHSPNKTAVVKGSLGYFIKRGRDNDDIKMQIFSKLKRSTVLFEENSDFKALSEKFDYLVIANGIPTVAKELGCWQQWFRGTVRGATVLGDFDPHSLIMWINKDYAKTGYAYLTPFSSKSASITLILSDVTEREADHYWELFLDTENIKYTIIDEFKLTHFSGHVYPHKIGNILFAGSAGGATDPFLGFGLFNSVEMGVMAARSIMEGMDYEKLLTRIIKRNTGFYEFRKAFNQLTNKGYDNLIAFIGLPGINQLVYHSPINVVKFGTVLFNAKKRPSRV